MTLNPRMMTLAREAKGITQSSLAHSIGVSQAYISQVEHGLEPSDPHTLGKLADELEVPPEFFEQPYQPLGEGLVDFFHRRRATLPAKPLKRAHAFANIARFEILQLMRSIELTDVAPFPTFSSEEYAPTEAAQAVRATWRVASGPLPNLVALIEAAAVPVVRAPLFHEKLGALSMPGLDGRHLVVLNGLMPASNLRYGLAHELGHLVMHVGHVGPEMEAEADQFASELLMPASDIKRQLQQVRFGDLGALKRSWHVSLAALTRRAHDLGTITDRQYRTFNMQLNKLPEGRKREPGEFPYEEPGLVRSVIEYFLGPLGYSLERLAHVMVTDPDTIAHRYLGAPPKERIRSVGRDENLYLFPLPPRSPRA